MPRPPSRGRVTDSFGWRTWTSPPRMHNGEDTIGAGNYAPCTGEVVYTGYFGGLGNLVGVREDANLSVIWWVGHHKDIWVTVGEQVREGVTKLGEIGTTGNSTGIHAHTERRVGGAASGNYGTPTDPRLYYTAAAGAPPTPFPTPSPKVRIDMPQRYQLRTNEKRLALAGHVGAACPGNWDEYLREDAKDGNRAPYEFKMFGEARIIDQAEWDRLKALYTTPAPVTVNLGDVTVTTDNSDVLEALAVLTEAVKAPRELTSK